MPNCPTWTEQCCLCLEQSWIVCYCGAWISSPHSQILLKKHEFFSGACQPFVKKKVPSQRDSCWPEALPHPNLLSVGLGRMDLSLPTLLSTCFCTKRIDMQSSRSPNHPWQRYCAGAFLPFFFLFSPPSERKCSTTCWNCSSSRVNPHLPHCILLHQLQRMEAGGSPGWQASLCKQGKKGAGKDAQHMEG